MTMYQRVMGLRDRCTAMLCHAQSIRIQQIQATHEAGWPRELKIRADEAWESLNRQSEAVEAELAKLAVELSAMESGGG